MVLVIFWGRGSGAIPLGGAVQCAAPSHIGKNLNLVFLSFGLWLLDVAIFDLKIGFFNKIYVYKPNVVKSAHKATKKMVGTEPRVGKPRAGSGSGCGGPGGGSCAGPSGSGGGSTSPCRRCSAGGGRTGPGTSGTGGAASCGRCSGAAAGTSSGTSGTAGGPRTCARSGGGGGSGSPSGGARHTRQVLNGGVRLSLLSQRGVT